jgi:hypothetical protein
MTKLPTNAASGIESGARSSSGVAWFGVVEMVWQFFDRQTPNQERLLACQSLDNRVRRPGLTTAER